MSITFIPIGQLPWRPVLTASEKMEEFNRRFQHKLSWLPWQRPGFELGLMLKKAVTDRPDCDGIILGGHGLFTWGDTQHQCYLNSLKIIDELGEFVAEHEKLLGERLFGGKNILLDPMHGRRLSRFFHS